MILSMAVKTAPPRREPPRSGDSLIRRLGRKILSMRYKTAMPTVNRPVLTTPDAERYAGKWVILKEGRVADAADDLKSLLARAKPDDVFYRIPDERQVF